MPEHVPNPDSELIADLLLEWEERLEKGEDVSPEILCGNRRDLIPILAKQIQLLRSVKWLFYPGPPVNGCLAGNGANPRVLCGRYRLEKIIGQGGFGTVWQGYDLNLERPVAVKVARPERLSCEPQLRSLFAEAKKVARLEYHPGIVQVYDVGSDGGEEFIVFQFVIGTNLFERMETSWLGVAHSLMIAADVADALHFAHEADILHLDVKPANILLRDPFARVMLTDFGIARYKEDAANIHSPVGTPKYMSPEQQLGSSVELGRQSDVYSLGIVLHELLTGVPPPIKAPGQPQSEESFPVRTPRTIPRLIEPIFRRCLARSPSDRYQTAAAAAEEMRAAASRLMTEHEWRKDSSAVRMLAHVYAMDQHARKVRLFACACARMHCRRLRVEIPQVILASECYAERPETEDELRRDSEAAWHLIGIDPRSIGAGFGNGKTEQFPDPNGKIQHFHEWSSIISTLRQGLLGIDERKPLAAAVACVADQSPLSAAIRVSFGIPERRQCRIWRDLFGPDQFTAPPPRPWLKHAQQAIEIARELDRSEEIKSLSGLADALERVGCDEAQILSHCRQRTHYRGCWVVDLLLGKE